MHCRTSGSREHRARARDQGLPGAGLHRGSCFVQRYSTKEKLIHACGCSYQKGILFPPWPIPAVAGPNGVDLKPLQTLFFFFLQFDTAGRVCVHNYEIAVPASSHMIHGNRYLEKEREMPSSLRFAFVKL